QSTPTAALAGTLVVASQSGASFSGNVAAQETDALGVPRNVAGIVSGHTLEASSIDFDVFFTTNARRHVGRVVADTMTGTWAEQGGAGALSGSFRAVRTSK